MLGTETVTGALTTILPIRGATFTITGEGWGLLAGAGAGVGLFGETSLTGGAGGAEADGGAGAGLFAGT